MTGRQVASRHDVLPLAGSVRPHRSEGDGLAPRALRRVATASSSLLAVPLLLAGCGLQDPVLRYPWLEDHSLSLERQQVAVAVDAPSVRVTTRFEFRRTGARTDRDVLFPIPPPCGDVQNFVAELAGPESEPLALETWVVGPGVLPPDEARQAFGIVLPGEALDRHDGVLLVRYSQRCSETFRFGLRAGAHWDGPVERIDIVVHDEAGRVMQASVDGRAPMVARNHTLRWTLSETEPRGMLDVSLRAVSSPSAAQTIGAPGVQQKGEP